MPAERRILICHACQVCQADAWNRSRRERERCLCEAFEENMLSGEGQIHVVAAIEVLKHFQRSRVLVVIPVTRPPFSDEIDNVDLIRDTIVGAGVLRPAMVDQHACQIARQ